MSDTASKIVSLCGNNGLQKKVRDVVKNFELTDEERKKIKQFAETHLVDLYKMGLEYSLSLSDDDYAEDEKEHMESDFNTQLNYWWIEMQSEWIRYNNLINYKMMIKGESDPVLEAKGSICSLFLEPVAKLLDTEELKTNINNLQTLVERSKNESMF